MSSIFFAKSIHNTGLLKNAVEFVSQATLAEFENNINTGVKKVCFKIENSGLTIFSANNGPSIATVKLKSSFFSIFQHQEDLCLSISLDILKSCFKYIHRSDIVSIQILKDEYENFPDKILFSINGNKGFCVKFNITQNIETEDINPKIELINAKTNRISNLYKELGGIKKNISITINEDKIKLCSNIIDMAESWVTFDNIGLYKNENDFKIKSKFLKIVSKLYLFDENCKIYIDSDNNNFYINTNIINFRESKTKILGSVEMMIKSD